MRFARKSALALWLGLGLSLCVSPLFAYDPPSGAEASYDWYSPLFMAGSPSILLGGNPAADALNPAANAIEQRFTLDASYIALVGLASGQTGWGNGANLSASVPSPYGVWGLGLRYLSVPASLVSMPLGSSFSMRTSFAKDLYPNLWVGLGLASTLGSRDSFDWSLGADLGFIHSLDKLGFMQKFRWGAVLAGLGKWYSPGSGTASSGDIQYAYPSPFSAKLGAAFDAFESKGLRLAIYNDLSFPFFQNLLYDVSLELSYKDILSLRIGWGLNVYEMVQDRSASLIPSFGFQAKIPITTSKKSDSFLAKQGWAQSEIQPSLAAQPLYGGIWGFATGITMPLGVVDRKAPKISAQYPASAHELYYLSPNADGKNDELVLPINIRDERYVKSYSFKVSDSQGQVVREIQNKEQRPENEGIKALWKRLLYKKTGIPIPKQITWDGRSASGEVVPDGEYSFSLESVDDNGNRGQSQVFKVAIDSTPPELSLAQPKDADELIFSPDGDGSKDKLTVALKGSAEDEWKISVLDSAGNVVRTQFVRDSALGDFSWDGTGDAGQILPDGLYKISVTTEDRGGNAKAASLDNIIIDTRQPPVSLTIDTAYFSPNGDGRKDSVNLSPGVPVRSGLASWKIVVRDKAGKECWKLEGQGAESLVASYSFEGKDGAGKALPEGQYQAQLLVSYVNGHKPEISSPSFTLDVSPPSAKVSADLAIFSPNGDGKQDEVKISQSASDEDAWKAEILDQAGKLVLSLGYAGKPDPSYVWDGALEGGARAADGSYTYRLSATDKAGNFGQSNELKISLDTEKKSVMLSADQRYFSPNGDGIKDSVGLVPSVQDNDKVAEWRFSVSRANAQVVMQSEGKARVPERFAWDGKGKGALEADGAYLASLWVRYKSGDEVTALAPAISLDNQFPAIELTASPLLFSPNGDGRKDVVKVSQAKASADSWEGSILDSAGKVVRSFAFGVQAGDFTWDGTDMAGNKLPDGRYRYQVVATDKAGNKTEKSIDGIEIDTRETSLFVTASRPGFSPNGDGKFDDLSFGFIVKLRDGLSSWSFTLKDSDGKPRKAWSGNDAASVPAKLAWDGKGDDGSLYESTYVGVFKAVYAKGDESEAQTAPIILDVSPPALNVVLLPMPFSPDNDGVDDELKLNLSIQDDSDIKEWRLEINEASVEESTDPTKAKRRLFMRYEGQGKPAERITWDGKSLKGELVEAATDYPYSLSVTDELGNASKANGLIAVDVLVIRDGNRLKIKVPSIVFRANFNDFKDLAQDKIDKNTAVLKRIAEILNRYKSYKVLIEGHANNIGKISGASASQIQKEEDGEVLPLSKSRADAVKAFLVQYGVVESRLSTAGRGSSEAVVDPKDADNRWKNRRVEFILEK